MGMHLVPVRRDSTDELHPRIYAALIGLTIWLVLSVWVLFSRGSYVGLSDSIITLFFAVFVGIPVMLWLSWRHNAEPQDQNREAAPFGEWAADASACSRVHNREQTTGASRWPGESIVTKYELTKMRWTGERKREGGLQYQQ